MASLKELSQGRSDILKISPNDLNIKEGWNGREANSADNLAHIAQLAVSIKNIGFDPAHPIAIYFEDDKAWVEDGHCRLLAVRQAIAEGAEIKTIPCINVPKLSAEQRVFNQLIHNSGKPFSPLEKAAIYDRLVKFGWSQTDIARKCGVTPSAVNQTLDLLQLPEKIKGLVLAGRVSSSMALATLKKHNSDVALAYEELTGAVQQATAEGSTRALPRHARTPSGATPKAPKVNFKSAIKEAFASCDIDTSMMDEDDFVEIRMPANVYRSLYDDWEIMPIITND